MFQSWLCLLIGRNNNMPQPHIVTYFDYHNLAEDESPLCEVCHVPAVDIHHIIFKSRGKDNSIENLIALCRKCHNRAHYKEQPYLTVKQLKESKIVISDEVQYLDDPQ